MELLVSVAVLDEMRDVLNRPAIHKKVRTLTPSRVAKFITRIEAFAVLIHPVPPAVSLSRDPKDSIYLNIAVAGSAEYVVSRDNDLLDLAHSTDAEAVAFRTAYPNIRILDPVAFLQTLQPPTPPSPPPTSNP